MLHASCFMFHIPQKGFTLLETIVALAILSAAIVGPMSLVSRGISGARISKNRIIASYLAQEGMEIVRGIKEQNAIAGNTDYTGGCDELGQWDFGLCTPSESAVSEWREILF